MYVCVYVFSVRVYAFALIMPYSNVVYAGACIISSAGHNVAICTKKDVLFFGNKNAFDKIAAECMIS